MEGLIEELEQRMAHLTATNAAQITQLNANNAAQMAQVIATNNELLQKINQLEAIQATFPPPPTAPIEYTDIVPIYATGNDIQLDAFKVIHEFNGCKQVYRSWRSQVVKLMQQIEQHQTAPKYASALNIVRAKIVGPASDILINNNTVLNIDAIIACLDESYADKRPLYIIEAEMTSITQQSKTLQEYYDAINQALNMVLSKINMTYKKKDAQESMGFEAEQRAIATFIAGMNSQLIRNAVYGNRPVKLAQAFSQAQHIQYDIQHLKMEQKTNEQQKNAKRANQMNPNFPKFQAPQQYNVQKPIQQFVPQPYQVQKPIQNFGPQFKPFQQRPTPMEVDTSKQFTQKSQQPNNQQNKRPLDASFQYTNKPVASFQHVNKSQRINHIDENDDVNSVSEFSMENNYDSETSEELSIEPNEESVFLEE